MMTTHKLKRWGLRGCGTLLGVMMALALGNPAVQAAERIVLTYGSLSMGIPVAELETLAQTGEASGDLSELLSLANQEPENLQRILVESFSINPTVASIALHTPAGERFLDLLGESIQPAAGVGGRSALRATLIAAAADGEISLLEILRLYPSPDIVVKGDRLINAYSQLVAEIAPWLRILTLGQ